MKKNILVLAILFTIFLTGCTSEEVRLQREYIAKAKEVSAKYGLNDASFSFTYEGEVFSIRSRKFSDLSDEQKYLYLRETDKIIENSNPRAWAMIVSGYVYQLHPKFESGFSENVTLIFPYGTPTGQPPSSIVFNPPVEVELISKTELDFLLAGDTASYLMAYEKNDWSLPYDERVKLRQMYDKGYVYYIWSGTKVLLLEADSTFAKIKLIENVSDKKAGSIAWIRKDNIKSFPSP